MKRNFIHKIALLFIMFLVSTSMTNQNEQLLDTTLPAIEPLYDNIWGTIYHAEARQCDATPTITGDGSRINPYHASEHRWIAISQEMLDCEFRVRLLNDSTSELFRGKIEYGDTVWIDSPYPQINGFWVVHDTKNKRYRNSIDFLQTKGDGSLYNNDSMWCGKFENIKIYRLTDAKILGATPMT
jgi:hypothetical protein